MQPRGGSVEQVRQVGVANLVSGDGAVVLGSDNQDAAVGVGESGYGLDNVVAHCAVVPGAFVAFRPVVCGFPLVILSFILGEEDADVDRLHVPPSV